MKVSFLISIKCFALIILTLKLKMVKLFTKINEIITNGKQTKRLLAVLYKMSYYNK